MRINTNVNAMNAQESAISVNKKLSNSLEKLSSGLRINKASDDASGLSIADKLRTQKNSIGQSIDNATSAIAMLQIADKAMAEQSNILDIVKTKLIQAKTATTSADGRKSIAKDINKLLDELNNIASQTNYNGMSLLQKTSTDNNAADSMSFQLGELSSNVIVTSSTVQSNTSGLDNLAAVKTVVSGGNITATEAGTALGILDNSLTDLNTMRSDFGSTLNQLESSMRNMMTTKTNIAAAESVIRDVDYAQESANFNKYNIIGQAGTYAQSQANAIQQNILRVLT